ncbi:MAG: hypothetical protein SGJ27_11645 [Candidatus Melainabacteria bacterium]|nr:hypothetical protein [Candidatus Melainabacteria bacterium]
MVESGETHKATKGGAVCKTCGKAVGATVSGSGETWSFRPKCRCSVGSSANKAEKADEKGEPQATEKSEPQASDKSELQASDPQAIELQASHIKSESQAAESEPHSCLSSDEQTTDSTNHEKLDNKVGSGEESKLDPDMAVEAQAALAQDQANGEAQVAIAPDRSGVDAQTTFTREQADVEAPASLAQDKARVDAQMTFTQDDMDSVDAEEKRPVDDAKDVQLQSQPDVKGEAIPEPERSGVDSGGWASVTSAKTANGPDVPESRKIQTKVTSSGWKTSRRAPKSFSSGNMMESGDKHESFISLGGSEDFAGAPVDDFNRPIAHEIGKACSNRATSGGAGSSGISGSGAGSGAIEASGAHRTDAPVSKPDENPVDWVPVKQKPSEAIKSQFANDTELHTLTNKTETHEEKVKPSTRKNIQDAFRRNRIKTIVAAVITVVLLYGAYSYATTKGLIKKVGIFNSNPFAKQQSKKGSTRQSKKKRSKS